MRGRISTVEPETLEDYYARVAAATDAEGRLPVGVEEMPGWDIIRTRLSACA